MKDGFHVDGVKVWGVHPDHVNQVEEGHAAV